MAKRRRQPPATNVGRKSRSERRYESRKRSSWSEKPDLPETGTTKPRLAPFLAKYAVPQVQPARGPVPMPSKLPPRPVLKGAASVVVGLPHGVKLCRQCGTAMWEGMDNIVVTTTYESYGHIHDSFITSPVKREFCGVECRDAWEVKDSLRERPNYFTGVDPAFRVGGTVTGRMSAKKANFASIPKSGLVVHMTAVDYASVELHALQQQLRRLQRDITSRYPGLGPYFPHRHADTARMGQEPRRGVDGVQGGGALRSLLHADPPGWAGAGLSGRARPHASVVGGVLLGGVQGREADDSGDCGEPDQASGGAA